MESDIFSLSICGAHVDGYRGSTEGADALSYRAYTKARPGLSGFCTSLICHNNNNNSFIHQKMYYLCSPIKVLEKNSDLKTQQPFEAVIGLLKTCKDEAVKHIFRYRFIFLSFASLLLYSVLGLNLPFMFYPGLVLLCAQCVWGTRKIHSACHVNTFFVWPVSNSGCSLVRCTVPSACSRLMTTFPWFLLRT